MLMRLSVKNISTFILAIIFFAFGSGVTLCKMVCLSSGEINISLNEEGVCCDDDNSCCDDENSLENTVECCTHSDNTFYLDNYVPADKVYVSPVSLYIDNYHRIQNIHSAGSNKNLATVDYNPPPPWQVEDISSFTHLLRI